MLFGGALLTALVAVAARAITGQPVETVLFSGQSGMPLVIQETAAGTVVVLLVAKAIAYSCGLGAGFRGGPIFPAAALGVAAGVLASLLIGVIQTFAVSMDHSLLTLLRGWGMQPAAALADNTLMKLTLAQVAPILPYLFLVLILIFRPRGLMGTREG